jgi:hypothetical protein
LKELVGDLEAFFRDADIDGVVGSGISPSDKLT